MSIKLEHVSFSYGEQEIFHDLSFSFPETGLVVLLGKSGCGKTTLLSLLSSTLKPSKGEIVFSDDHPSIVFQSPVLLPFLTVEENVALPLLLNGAEEKDIREKVKPILEKLDILSYQKRYPYLLSGGEQMRVSLARALIEEKKAIILDEPTGQLDEKNALVIYQMLKKIEHDHLIVLVTHDEKNAHKFASYLYLMEEGKLKRIKGKEFKDEIVPLPLKEKKKSISIKNTLFLTHRCMQKKKLRVVLSLVFLCFNFLLLYLGLDFHNHLDTSMNSLYHEYYASDVVSLYSYQEIASAGQLHLKKESIPDNDVLSQLRIEETYPCLNYFLPQSQELTLNGKNATVSFNPVIRQQKEKIKQGRVSSDVNEIVVNENLCDEVGLSIEEMLGKVIHIYHSTIVKSNLLKNSDHFTLSISFKVVGVSKEKTAFNSSCAYYSQPYLLDYLSTVELSNISSELGYSVSVKDLLLDETYKDDDILGNNLLCLSDDPFSLNEKCQRIYENKVKVSSPMIEIKKSSEEIITSLMSVFLFFIAINTLCAFMMEFLSIYSLFLNNLRLFALIHAFSHSKKDCYSLAGGFLIYFFSLSTFFTLCSSLLIASILNFILQKLSYPAFFVLFDPQAFLIIVLLSLGCSLISALLPLSRIKAKDLKKELEGED